MLYTIVDKFIAEIAGFRPSGHLGFDGKMVLNENELRTKGSDISDIAYSMGGVLLTRHEAIETIKRSNNSKQENK